MAAAKTSASRLQAAAREREVLALRMAGATYVQIAEKLGITPSGAYRVAARVLERLKAEANEQAEELRQVEADRLDALQLAVWPLATRGNLGAVDRVLRIMARRADLLGLDAPARAPVDEDGKAVATIAILGPGANVDDI